MPYPQQLIGALVSALIALPLGLAFGVASGLGAEAGVLSAVIAGFIAALWSGTAGQHSGPTGAVSVILALSVAHFTQAIPNNPEAAVMLTFAVVVLAGSIQMLFGWLKWGRFIEYLPHSVISGLLSAIGIMLILEQLPAILGGENWVYPLEVIMALPSMLSAPSWPELILGCATISFMMIWPKHFPRLNRYLPAPVMVLVMGVIIVSLLSHHHLLAVNGVWWMGDFRVIGELSFHLPSLHLPSLEVWQLPYLVQTAFTLAVVASLVSLLGSVVTEKMTRQTHDPDKELMGQGMSNIASGLFGGMASTGAPMRTTVAMSYGSRSSWAVALHALLVGVLAFSMQDFFAQVPLAVLGGLLIKVGLDQIDWSYLKRWRAIPKAGKTMMLAVLATAILLDLVSAVVVGLAMASFVLFGRMTQLQLNALHLGRNPSELPAVWFTETEKALLEKTHNQLVIAYLDVPMSFGAARGLSRRVLETQGKAYVLDFRSVPYVDFSSAMVLDDLIYRLQSRGAKVWLLLALGDAQDQLTRQGVLSKLNGRTGFDREVALQEALTFIQQMTDKH
jgi:sulfate permease, SulP family